MMTIYGVNTVFKYFAIYFAGVIPDTIYICPMHLGKPCKSYSIVRAC